jgi:hypothetical protein
MSSPTTSPRPAERRDIHKSCRTLETLVNVLNDYCEAAEAIVALQRKLSKALKEAASLKTTSEIAGDVYFPISNQIRIHTKRRQRIER